MKVARNIADLKQLISAYKLEGKTIGFVPTMGALHDGHISLLNNSLTYCDVSVVSIYINSSQFNQASDFDNYPRTEEVDIFKLAANKCDVVFLPNVEEIEKLPLPGNVDLGGLGNVMEGAKRPGHFQGVIEIVFRLFQCVCPDKAFFGEKDFQQIMVVRKMVLDTNLEVEIIDCDIKREKSGLAMSSRNVKLSATGKVKAAQIYNVLITQSLISTKTDILTRLGFDVEYIEVHKLGNLSRLFAAVWLEGVRLIDNIAVD